MATIDQRPARLDIFCAEGDDLTVTLSVTESGSPWVSTGATVVTSILNRAGTAQVTNFTTAVSTGSLTLTLTDTQTTTLGAGVYRYYVQVTKSGVSRTWVAGGFTVAPDSGTGTSSSSASLSITTDTVTLDLTTLVAPTASNISFTPSGSLAATTVQAAITEASTDLDAHLSDTVDAHDASAISVADSGNYYTGTNVETVLAEISETPSTSTRRLVELATDSETTTLTDTQRAVTPSNLAALRTALDGRYKGGIAYSASTVTVTNTAAETTLISESVSNVGAGDLFMVSCWGTLLNNTGGSQTLQWKFKIGATTVITTQAGSHGTNAAIKAWHADFLIQVGASTSAQVVRSSISVAGSATGTVGGNLAAPAVHLGRNTATEDWSTAKVVALTATWGIADSNLVLVQEGYNVRRVGAPLV